MVLNSKQYSVNLNIFQEIFRKIVEDNLDKFTHLNIFLNWIIWVNRK